MKRSFFPFFLQTIRIHYQDPELAFYTKGVLGLLWLVQLPVALWYGAPAQVYALLGAMLLAIGVDLVPFHRQHSRADDYVTSAVMLVCCFVLFWKASIGYFSVFFLLIYLFCNVFILGIAGSAPFSLLGLTGVMLCLRGVLVADPAARYGADFVPRLPFLFLCILGIAYIITFFIQRYWVEKLQQQKRHLEQGNVMVQRKIEEAVASFSNDEVLTGKILENSVLQQVVSGANSGPSCSAQTAKGGNLSERVAGRYPISEDDGSDSAALLDTVTSRINECFGRDMGKNDVANVLICLAQGYITTFAGLPGTGKTSLVNILAEVLGLKNAAAQRFVEVPVEKGWTSYKDFIGYYNPFSKSLEKSNAAVFDALSLLSAESAAQLAPGEVAPYLVLLDEANLSSIEHYWSPFLRACDSFRKGPFELSLGGNHAFAVPTYLRFVATVNFDHTTEELSPRFLDRSWVVTLDPQTFELEDTESALRPFDAAAADAYSYQAIQAAFGAKGSSMLSVELKAKLKEVLDLCARHRYPVSPRSQKMMLEYAYAASGLMAFRH